MKPITVLTKEMKLTRLLEYINENVGELLFDYDETLRKIILIDNDYHDVILDEEAYDDIEDEQDYENLLLNEEYALLLTVAKTNENLDTLEFITGDRYSLSYYAKDQYESETIKDIGDLSLNMNNLISLYVDYYDNEIHISLVNFEYSDEVMNPKINEIEDGGDFEEIVLKFIEKFN